MTAKNGEVDVVIVGAGAVGAACGYALSLRGLTVAIIDAEPERERASVRTSALSRRSCAWLASLGLWPAHGVSAAPLRALQVVDRSGQGRLRFDSADIDQEDLGVIVNHSRLEGALRERARSASGVRWYSEVAERVSVGNDEASITLAGGRLLQAPLLIAADGVQSTVREQLGVAAWQYRYGQTAVCADIQLGVPHEGVAWQRFLTTGPVALLPLPDLLRSSLIWSTTQREAQSLKDLSDGDFAKALQTAFGQDLGSLRVASPRAYFPLVASHAQHYVGPRFALVGDAAHRVHPLAGQGLNLGFGDAQALTWTLQETRGRGGDFGGQRALRSYERARKGANLSMLMATDLLNRAFRHENSLLRGLLTVGLNITDTLQPLKAFFMSQAGAHATNERAST